MISFNVLLQTWTRGSAAHAGGDKSNRGSGAMTDGASKDGAKPKKDEAEQGAGNAAKDPSGFAHAVQATQNLKEVLACSVAESARRGSVENADSTGAHGERSCGDCCRRSLRSSNENGKVSKSQGCPPRAVGLGEALGTTHPTIQKQINIRNETAPGFAGACETLASSKAGATLGEAGRLRSSVRELTGVRQTNAPTGSKEEGCLLYTSPSPRDS